MKKNHETKKTALSNVPTNVPIRNATAIAPVYAPATFNTMRQLTDEIEKMFGDLFNFNASLNPFFTPTFALPTFEEFELPLWTPQIDASIKNGELKVHADLPGLKKEDIGRTCSPSARRTGARTSDCSSGRCRVSPSGFPMSCSCWRDRAGVRRAPHGSRRGSGRSAS